MTTRVITFWAHTCNVIDNEHVNNSFCYRNNVHFESDKSPFIRSVGSGMYVGAPVAQWVKHWPTDLADRVRSSLEVKSSQP